MEAGGAFAQRGISATEGGPKMIFEASTMISRGPKMIFEPPKMIFRGPKMIFVPSKMTFRGPRMTFVPRKMISVPSKMIEDELILEVPEPDVESDLSKDEGHSLLTNYE